jgi:hypothetical protein
MPWSGPFIADEQSFKGRVGDLTRKPPLAAKERSDEGFSTPHVVAIGVSTGGPKALEQILPYLPADLLVPILIVQHMPAGFTAPFAERLNKMGAVKVREAAHAEIVRPGVVYPKTPTPFSPRLLEPVRYFGLVRRVPFGSSTSLCAPAGADKRNEVSGPSAKTRPSSTGALPETIA